MYSLFLIKNSICICFPKKLSKWICFKLEFRRKSILIITCLYVLYLPDVDVHFSKIFSDFEVRRIVFFHDFIPLLKNATKILAQNSIIDNKLSPRKRPAEPPISAKNWSLVQSAISSQTLFVCSARFKTYIIDFYIYIHPLHFLTIYFCI